MLTRAQKEEEVADLREKFARATSVFLADYRGLDVQAVSKLRGRLRAEGGDFEYRVAKNTLLRRAAAGSEVDSLGASFRGPTALALSFGDPVRLAKVLVEYAREHEVFDLKAGIVEGRTIDREEIARLATLPPLEGLRARIVGLVQAPASKLAQLLTAPGGQLARVVGARQKQLEEADVSA